MNLSDTAARELWDQGQAFASRHAVMAQASNLRQFRRHVLLTVGSAFALAQYTEDHVRARRQEIRAIRREPVASRHAAAGGKHAASASLRD